MTTPFDLGPGGPPDGDAGGDYLRRLYRELPEPGPNPELEARLQALRPASARQPSAPRRRWRLPASLAAGVAIASVSGLLVLEQRGPAPEAMNQTRAQAAARTAYAMHPPMPATALSAPLPQTLAPAMRLKQKSILAQQQLESASAAQAAAADEIQRNRAALVCGKQGSGKKQDARCKPPANAIAAQHPAVPTETRPTAAMTAAPAAPEAAAAAPVRTAPAAAFAPAEQPPEAESAPAAKPAPPHSEPPPQTSH